jgi:hypothetical protein
LTEGGLEGRSDEGESLRDLWVAALGGRTGAAAVIGVSTRRGVGREAVPRLLVAAEETDEGRLRRCLPS